MKKSNSTKVMGKPWKVAGSDGFGLSDCKAQLFTGVNFSKFLWNLSRYHVNIVGFFETELGYRTQSQHFKYKINSSRDGGRSLCAQEPCKGVLPILKAQRVKYFLRPIN